MTSTRTTTLVPAGTWEVDPAHSSVEFSVKHMGIANVRGRFTNFQGIVEVGQDAGSAKARGNIKVASIDTGEAQRDTHLRSADFFDVDAFPEITYESTRAEPLDENSSRVWGNLTMHGITREVKLDLVLQGTDIDPWGNERSGDPRVPEPQRFRYEIQPGARQWQSAGRRQSQDHDRDLRHPEEIAEQDRTPAE